MSEIPIALDVATPLGFRVVCSEEYWQRIITIKHPPMKGREADVLLALSDPDEIRRSVGDPDVLLFHRRTQSRWICAVIKRLEGKGYLITTYPADKVKQGDLIWKK
jgi:hypothetical protein